MKTVYQDLIERSDRCLAVAMKTEGIMSAIWRQKSIELKAKARDENLSIADALEVRD